MRLWYLLIVCLCLTGCESQQEIDKKREEARAAAEKDPNAGHYKIMDIQRVLMHNPGSFTVFAQDGKTLKPTYFWQHEVTIYNDVSEGEPVWAEGYQVPGTAGGRPINYVSIHIHHGREIDGGGWSVSTPKKPTAHFRNGVLE